MAGRKIAWALALSMLTAPIVLAPSRAEAVALINGLGGPTGFGEHFLAANDDDSTEAIPLPFLVNFFGHTFDSLNVNNNGNVTFGSGLTDYTPEFFPGAPWPMIAPFWADVDTRGSSSGTSASGLVYYNSPDSSTFIVTWNNVGYFDRHDDKLNNFQLVLRDLAPTTGNLGDFLVEFRYDRLEWTTGDLTDAGLGGKAAVAGFDAGNYENFEILPGSGTEEVLNLASTSNVGIPGLWKYRLIEGGFGSEVPPQSDVPGPLPLLGTGITFVWSRRLRRRIAKASTTNTISTH